MTVLNTQMFNLYTIPYFKGFVKRICEKISNKNDIWYATNMEIYEYVTSYNSLIYSANGSKVYNPTLVEIWFDVDGVLYFIRPGETIRIDQ